ncbi:diacylglycerol O-acyltransferase 3-like [Primulina tabacum]|uniref:diacylglycerol O-acyltransferase 3-like n=1 Tax=Primulina tabacum TaxID=48773 RepID=UPI003F5A6997
MEASGLIFSQPPCFSSITSCRESKYCGRSGVLPGFYDNACLQYYHNRGGKSSCEVSSMGVIRCEKAVKENKGPMKMKKKKQMKLLKGLFRDLYAFSQMGFGLDSNLDQDLLHQVKGTTMTEAADLLLEHLQKLRAEKRLEKKRRQEQKKLGKSSGQMRNSLNLVEVSSSCSESSSDSECGEVIDLKDLKFAQPKQEESVLPSVLNNDALPPSPITPSTFTLPTEKSSGSLETECSSKLEVCMGGKCKKSGAVAILDEFKKAVGIEGAVSGCKCMGQCRDGPNVRVLIGEAGDSRSVPINNPLFIGVGLEDVDKIVSNFLGKPGFAAAT